MVDMTKPMLAFVFITMPYNRFLHLAILSSKGQMQTELDRQMEFPI